MRLQLDSTGIQGAGSGYTTEVSSAGGGRGANSASRATSDSVGLSGTSRVLQTAQNSHAERLARIGQAVRAGTYSVSSQAIGQAIVQQAGSPAVSGMGR